MDAFEKEAVDYLLKPVLKERLEKTVDRLKSAVTEPFTPSPQTVDLLRSLVDHVASPTAPDYLQWLSVQQGDGVQLIAVSDVVYFQAKDKYTAVITKKEEFLIRKSIRALIRELSPNSFWQIHRGTIVNLTQIAKVSRSITGRGVIRLKDRIETLTVSRPYLHQFRQM